MMGYWARRVLLALWSLGLYPRAVCPLHRVELTPHGFEGHNRRYTCDAVKGCRYGDMPREVRA